MNQLLHQARHSARHLPSCSCSCLKPFAAASSNYSTTPPALRKKIPEVDLSEKFVKGSGPGGQKINKVKNMVQLRHLPTGIMVQCQEARSLTANRSIARKLLERKVDHHLNGTDSSIGRSILKKQRRKQRGRRRAKKRLVATGKHDGDSDSAEEDDDEDEEPVRIELAGPSWATVVSNATSGGKR